MVDDWRFQNSPAVEISGLRAYAGTQLRCKVNIGEDITLGSLCIASSSASEPLSQSKQLALTRFADMLSQEIVKWFRMKRQKQRHHMSELISEIQVQSNSPNIEEIVLDTIRQIYPHARVTSQSADCESILVRGRPPVPVEAFKDGLWEDSQFLDSLLLTENHVKLQSSQCVRAIIGQYGRDAPQPRYITVDSTNVRLVFDDVDAWFVEKASLMLCNILQKQALEEALNAKETFLRGITHQLRTPIHGVLGSCELLAEEFDSRDLVDTLGKLKNEKLTSLRAKSSSIISTINSSGRDLMSTVNNIIALNRWAEISASPPVLAPYNMYQLESDINAHILQIVPPTQLIQTSVFFDNDLPTDAGMIITNSALLLECLRSLILNAIQFTECGNVTIRFSTAADYSVLKIDVMDTGCGIAFEDQERIFEPYEKCDTLTRGAGLGLTLAARIASALKGTVSLISSTKGKGSHFRVDLHDPGFTCSWPCKKPTKRIHMVKTFNDPSPNKDSSVLLQHFAQYLERHGLVSTSYTEASLILAPDFCDTLKLKELLERCGPEQLVICLAASEASLSRLDDVYKHSKCLIFIGPFFTKTLDDMLRQIDERHKSLMTKKHPPLHRHDTPVTLNVPLHPPKIADKDLHITPPARALLVDDNPVNIRIMRMYCEKRHIPYVLAEDGFEAIAAYEKSLHETPINLILMDLQMPNCDGVDAIAAIRKIEEKSSLSRSTIFMVTGQDSENDKKRSFIAGADEFYVKPVGLKMLDKAIGKYFDHKASK